MTKTSKESGISLIEVIVVAGLMSLGLSVGYMLINYTMRSFETVALETFLQQNSRSIEAVIKKELRNIVDLSTDKDLGLSRYFKIKDNYLINNGNKVSINIVDNIYFSTVYKDEVLFLKYKIVLNHQEEERIVRNKIGLNNLKEISIDDISLKNNTLFYEIIDL